MLGSITWSEAAKCSRCRRPPVKGRKLRVFKRREKDAVAGVVRSIAGTEEQGAFCGFDLAAVADLYSRWCRALDGVRPYYAVKCNPEPAMLGAMAALGSGFDCASRAEIEAVLALGVVEPGSIVYANPCKPEALIEYAARVGVNLTTYDSEEEVAKVKRCHPGCELILRIKGPDNPDAKIDLGTKYGARADEVVPLLRAAQSAGLRVAGVAFHVGACTSRVDVYRGAIEAARVAFDAAAQLGMPPMRVLDIGGAKRRAVRLPRRAATHRWRSKSSTSTAPPSTMMMGGAATGRWSVAEASRDRAAANAPLVHTWEEGRA